MNPLSKLGADRRQMTGAILTSYPFDSHFYERALLNVVGKKGIGSKNVVLVDSSKYEQTFGEGANAASLAGVEYHLAPVDLPGRQVFHPKVFFFGGERRAYALVGSANLTQKGFTDNAELASYFAYENNDSDDSGAQLQVLRRIRTFLHSLVDSEYTSIGEMSRSVAVEDILGSCDWLEDIDERTLEEHDIWFLHNLDEPILDQVAGTVASEDVIEEAVVVAPFFGESIQVLERLSTWTEGDVRAYLQQDEAQVDVDQLEQWVEQDGGTVSVFAHDRFIHGKLLLLKAADGAYCLTGSPNPSYQGLLAAASTGGNIETAILRRADDPEYFDYLLQTEILAEPVDGGLDDFRPRPDELVEDVPKVSTSPPIRLREATYSQDTTFSGGYLTLVAEIAGDDGDLSGHIRIETTDGSGLTVPFADTDIDARGEGVVELSYRVTADDKRSVLYCRTELLILCRDRS